MNVDKSPEKIKTMFNRIASVYDFMNNIISLGTDKIIKLNCIKTLQIKPDMNVLDLCTGTGDIPKMIKGVSPKTKVIGVDFSEEMLKIARKKNPNIQFINADCTNLPFADNSFDIITICYGLRNIENRKKATEEMYRVLKPEGKLLHLDFGQKNFAGKIFEYYVPFCAKFFTNYSSGYKYLIDSKKQFPVPEELIKEFDNFNPVEEYDFIFKSISCRIFKK